MHGRMDGESGEMGSINEQLTMNNEQLRKKPHRKVRFFELIWMLGSENIRIAGLYDFNLIFGHAKDMQDFGTAFRTG